MGDDDLLTEQRFYHTILVGSKAAFALPDSAAMQEIATQPQTGLPKRTGYAIVRTRYGSLAQR